MYNINNKLTNETNHITIPNTNINTLVIYSSFKTNNIYNSNNKTCLFCLYKKTRTDLIFGLLLRNSHLRIINKHIGIDDSPKVVYEIELLNQKYYNLSIVFNKDIIIKNNNIVIYQKKQKFIVDYNYLIGHWKMNTLVGSSTRYITFSTLTVLLNIKENNINATMLDKNKRKKYSHTLPQRPMSNKAWKEMICLYNNKEMTIPYKKQTNNQMIYYKFQLVYEDEYITNSCTDQYYKCFIPHIDISFQSLGLCYYKMNKLQNNAKNCDDLNGDLIKLIDVSNPSSYFYNDKSNATFNKYHNCSSLITGSFMEYGDSYSLYTTPSVVQISVEFNNFNNNSNDVVGYKSVMNDETSHYMTTTYIGGCPNALYYSQFMNGCVQLPYYVLDRVFYNGGIYFLLFFLVVFLITFGICLYHCLKLKANKQKKKKLKKMMTTGDFNDEFNSLFLENNY